MAWMTLQEAIDYAISPKDPTPFGIEVIGVISMHDDDGTVMWGAATFPNFTFRPDLPLTNWGTATISRGGLWGGGWLAPTQVPGFSTRGQGGLNLNVATGNVPTTTIQIDLSVRRNPGRPGWSFLGLGPSTYIEIDMLSPAGAATGGVTLKAVESGPLVKAEGPSMRDPASTASYTFTVWVYPRIG